MVVRTARSLTLCPAIISLFLAPIARAAIVPKDSAELLQETAVWTVHLTFTPDEWNAMEPKDSGRGPFGGPGGPRGPGGPGRFGPGPISSAA